jgi:hypothetical protein
MVEASLYDTDVLAWSEQQAAALRDLLARRDLPNQLDLANVIEEIEGVGRSELHAAESLIENILVHLIMLAADPEAPAVRGWNAEITAWTATLRRRITPSMHTRIDLDSIWTDAVRIASAKLLQWDERKASEIRSVLHDTACPVTIPILCADVEIAEVVARIHLA